MTNNIKRLMPVLFIMDGLIVMSKKFSLHQIIGNVIDQARRLNEWDVDELIYIDISRTRDKFKSRDDIYVKSFENIKDIISSISKVSFMPLSFGGGIRSVKDVEDRIYNGADKIIINSLLFTNKEIVSNIIDRFGSQAVIASIDYKIHNSNPIIFNDFGRKQTDFSLIDGVKYLEDLGVGEIFLQNIERDGSAKGYDIENIKKVCNVVDLPVIACSGGGQYEHFEEVSKIEKLSGIAAGNIFNFKENAYPIIKKKMKDNQLFVR